MPVPAVCRRQSVMKVYECLKPSGFPIIPLYGRDALPALLFLLVPVLGVWPLQSLQAHGDAHATGARQSLTDSVAPLSEAASAEVARVQAEAARAVVSPALGGQWSAVFDWPLVAVHAALLPNGKVLAWDATPDDADDDPHTTDNYTTRVTLWDPLDNSHTPTNNDTDTDLFCAGSAHLWDGRILFAGGDGGRAGANGPLANSNIYHPASNTWRRTENMQAPRWYSSVAALGNGEMLTFGGSYAPSPLGEVFQFDQTWRALDLQTPFEFQGDYQWLQHTPDGKVFSFGPQNLLARIDTAGSGGWQTGSVRDDITLRDYGSYAMFDVGKILVSGGGDSTATAVIIETESAQSSDAGLMNVGRRQHNLTILADGSVLVTGGNTDGTQYYSAAGTTREVERWDPDSGRFELMNPMAGDRQYHSIALLLPDGRVLSAGGGICGDCYAAGYEQRTAEIYSPPYLFDGNAEAANRPMLASVPATADYSERLTVPVARSDGSPVSGFSRVHLIKLGSVTHSENQDQRLVPLQFEVGAGALSVILPASRDVAPPGHYLLFAVDDAGVPSPGAILRLGQPLLEPGQRVVSTHESNTPDVFVLPTEAGQVSASLNGDASLSVSIVAGLTGGGEQPLPGTACRSDAGSAGTVSCQVTAAQATDWYITVNGPSRSDFTLDVSFVAQAANDDDNPSTSPTPQTPVVPDDPTVPVGVDNPAPGNEPVSESSDEVADSASGSGSGSVGLIWVLLLAVMAIGHRRCLQRPGRSRASCYTADLPPGYRPTVR